MMNSLRSQNEELGDRLELCMSENADLSSIVLHPYVGSYFTSNPVSYTVEGDMIIEDFYIYLCVSCTDCDVCSTSYCYDPCDPCNPYCDPCCTTTCCTPTGPYDAIRLTVRVTTDLDEETQSIQVVTWKWV